MECEENPLTGESAPVEAAPQAGKKKKKDKVRSAWISFIGRIIAQILGAVATITLGLALADRLRFDATQTAVAADSTPPSALLSTAPLVPQDPRPGVAVLPLESFSPNLSQQPLADAMTDELIGDLMAVSRLRVVSRTSAARYRQHPATMPQIGRELGVDIVIEGSLVRDGDRIRVTARVIEARRDAHLGTVSERRRPWELLIRTPGLASSMARELADIIVTALHPD